MDAQSQSTVHMNAYLEGGLGHMNSWGWNECVYGFFISAK